MRILYYLPILILLFGCEGQSLDSKNALKSDRDQILEIMRVQEQAWSNGNIEGFMQAYENSDSLLFVGSSGPSYGYNTVLNNYRRSYPGKKGMGKLNFKVLQLDLIESKHAHMVGEWKVTKDSTQLSGYFSLLWKKIDRKWKIIRDHSS